MLKRIFDTAFSAMGLILLSPLFLIIGITIATKLGWPIFFRQIRAGLHEEPFNMIKFRTMTNAKGKEGNLLPNEERLTPFGRFLRSTSLDELPELFNVIKGDMSLVGPRPLLMHYLPYYDERQSKRHEVKPGITGWSQVNGRNAVEWDQKLAMDIWYVRNRSFWLDIKILWLTLFKVFKREGITYEDHVAMPPFDEYVKQKRKKYEGTDQASDVK